MNQFQITYSLALLALTVPAWGRQRYALACLWGNLIATLAICFAMDMGLDPDTSRLSMMITDLATGAVLAIRQGLPRVIAAGYAITVPFYALAISGLFTRGDAAFTLIYVAAALQIGALAIGSLGGHSGGIRRRLSSGRLFVASQAGDHRLLPGSISRDAGERA